MLGLVCKEKRGFGRLVDTQMVLRGFAGVPFLKRPLLHLRGFAASHELAKPGGGVAGHNALWELSIETEGEAVRHDKTLSGCPRRNVLFPEPIALGEGLFMGVRCGPFQVQMCRQPYIGGGSPQPRGRGSSIRWY
jgi:hypothetical protein